MGHLPGSASTPCLVTFPVSAQVLPLQGSLSDSLLASTLLPEAPVVPVGLLPVAGLPFPFLCDPVINAGPLWSTPDSVREGTLWTFVHCCVPSACHLNPCHMNK